MQVDQQPAPLREPGQPTVFFQDLCLKHKSLHSKNDLERPERLRAVAYGVGAIFGRLEEANKPQPAQEGAVNDPKPPVTIVRSNVTVRDLLDLPAGRAVLGTKLSEDSPQVYGEMLREWCKDSKKKLRTGEKEIPPGFEADLYCAYPISRGLPRDTDALVRSTVCPQSYEAFCGAAATVCEAVDAVATASSNDPRSLASGTRAFVGVRTPGHHCLPVSSQHIVRKNVMLQLA